MKTTTLTIALVTALGLSACATTAETAADATTVSADVATEATPVSADMSATVATSGTPAPASTSSMPEPAAASGMSNKLSVTYQCATGGELKVDYSGVSDMTTSTATLTHAGQTLTLPRAGANWDDRKFVLEPGAGNISKAPVVLMERVAGSDQATVHKDKCVAANASA